MGGYGGHGRLECLKATHPLQEAREREKKVMFSPTCFRRKQRRDNRKATEMVTRQRLWRGINENNAMRACLVCAPKAAKKPSRACAVDDLSTAQNRTVQYITTQYSTVRYGTVRYGTVQYSTGQEVKETLQYAPRGRIRAWPRLSC